MNRGNPIRFDLAVPNANGLRRGRTTGSCATAAVKAALELLLHGERAARVPVSLPDGIHYVDVPIAAVRLDGAGAHAEVIKDGGDDPDNTHGATIFADVRRNDCGTLRFFAGAGVGTVTQPGLSLAVGEPAINNVPRQMMRLAVAEVLEGGEAPGFDLTIGCVDGERIAQKTFNPRLGIVGGISILGTTGIVEPYSLSSWQASVELNVRVALADAPRAIGLLPGKIGRDFATQSAGLADKRCVQIANFLGAALASAQRFLDERGWRLDTLWIIGHPGKLAKVLDGVWDTHSQKSAMAIPAVARVAAECGLFSSRLEAMRDANTVEAIMMMLRDQPEAPALWREIEQRIATGAAPRVARADRVEVRLFGLHDSLLGAAA